MSGQSSEQEWAIDAGDQEGELNAGDYVSFSHGRCVKKTKNSSLHTNRRERERRNEKQKRDALHSRVNDFWNDIRMAINLWGQNPHQSCSGNCTGAATLVQAMVEGDLAINPKFGIMSLEAVEERGSNIHPQHRNNSQLLLNILVLLGIWECH